MIRVTRRSGEASTLRPKMQKNYTYLLNKTCMFIQNRCKKTFTKKPRGKFFDKLRIHVRGGAGGQGFPKYNGIGGKGGDVILRAVKGSGFTNLVDVNPTQRYTAGTGANSAKKVLIGQPGEDQLIPVPLGVTVTTDNGRVIGDLNEDGQEVIAARGGDPGGPENNFLGRKGEAHSVTLDLKLIADIGLVGFPNAGKSTFLSSVSRASPKIADYPFTTVRPQIGIMEYPDFRQIKVADLPGLIEGAHVNFGMGHKFLKHVERTKLLLFMVDINGFQLSQQYEHRTAFETILLLNKELELFNIELLKKPAVLALNKIDTDEGGERTDAIVDQILRLPDSLSEVDELLHPENLMRFDEIYKISTMFDQNMLTMKNRLRKLLDIYNDREEKELSQQMREENMRLDQQERVLGKEHNRNKIV